MEPHRNIVHNRLKHPAVLWDENLCFYVPMWFKKVIGCLILIVSYK